MLTRFIRIKEVQKISGLRRPSLSRLEREGLFPKRKKLGSHAVGWREDEVREWLDSRPTNVGSSTTKRNLDSKEV